MKLHVKRAIVIGMDGYHLFVSGNWAKRPVGGPRDPETLDPSALQNTSEVDPVELKPVAPEE